jgi:hypothetical protein
MALGEAGLKAKEEELRLAKAFNDRDIPTEVLDSFGVPDVSLSHAPHECVPVRMGII